MDSQEYQDTKSKRKSTKGRKLMRWSPEVDQNVLLAVQQIVARHGVPLDWDAVAKLVSSTLTGEAINQHLIKLRKAMGEADQLSEGLMSFTNTTPARSARKRKTAAADTDDSNQFSQPTPTSTSVNKSGSLLHNTTKLKLKKPAIKNEPSSDTDPIQETPTKKAKTAKRPNRRQGLVNFPASASFDSNSTLEHVIPSIEQDSGLVTPGQKMELRQHEPVDYSDMAEQKQDEEEEDAQPAMLPTERDIATVAPYQNSFHTPVDYSSMPYLTGRAGSNLYPPPMPMDLGGTPDTSFDSFGGYYGGYGYQSDLEGLWDGDLLGMPTVSGFPELPTGLGLPEMPAVPDLPEMPAVPGLPEMGNFGLAEDLSDFGLSRKDNGGPLYFGFQ